MIPGENVIVAGPANFTVLTVDSPTQFTGTFLGLDGDLSVGSTISIGAEVSPTGMPGIGLNGFALTTSSFVVPSVGSTVAVPVNNSGAFVVGEFVVSTGPANFIVTAIGSSTSLTLKFLGNPGDVSPGATVALGSTITAAGTVGGNAWTTNTVQFTIPAIGSNVTVSLQDARWMEVGQNVVFAGPATFKVVSTNVVAIPNTAVLTFLGYVGDLAPANVIANGTGVSPAGVQPNAGQTVSVVYTTPYTLTQNATPQDSGVRLVIPAAGTWRLTAIVELIGNATYNGFNGLNPLTIAFERTNNTPTQLANATTFFLTEANVGFQQTFGIIPMEFPAYVTTNSNDSMSIYASYTQALQAGNAIINSIRLIAQQIG